MVGSMGAPRPVVLRRKSSRKAGLSLSLVCTVVLAILFGFNSISHAIVIQYHLPADATISGLDVDATATFTTGNGQVSVLLENLQANPRSVMQCLNGVRFELSTGENAGAMASSNSAERLVASGGVYTAGRASVDTGWAVSTAGQFLKFSLLGTHMAPDHMLIGPPASANDRYSNANTSITNGVHSPFLAQSASFVLNVPGVTPSSTITAAWFLFNTSGDFGVSGITVPEPATCGSTALALSSLMMRRRRVA